MNTAVAGSRLNASGEPIQSPSVGWRWRADALCQQAPPALFDSTDDADSIDAALRWCEQCPVRRECRSVGIAVSGFGVWGGNVLVNGHVHR